MANSLLSESLIVDRMTKIHRSDTGRWVADMVHVDQPDASEIPQPNSQGTWVLVGENALLDHASVAKSLGLPASQLATINVEAWVELQRKLTSLCTDKALRNTIEGEQFRILVESLQSIRDQSQDTITGIILCLPSGKASNLLDEIELTKLLSQLLLTTQPDNLCDVVLIAAQHGKLAVTEEWLRWHSVRRGLHSTLVTGYGTAQDSAIAVALLSRPRPTRAVRHRIRKQSLECREPAFYHSERFCSICIEADSI